MLLTSTIASHEVRHERDWDADIAHPVARVRVEEIPHDCVLRGFFSFLDWFTLAGCLEITQADAAVMEAPNPSIVCLRLPVFTDTYS